MLSLVISSIDILGPVCLYSIILTGYCVHILKFIFFIIIIFTIAIVFVSGGCQVMRLSQIWYDQRCYIQEENFQEFFSFLIFFDRHKMVDTEGARMWVHLDAQNFGQTFDTQTWILSGSSLMTAARSRMFTSLDFFGKISPRNIQGLNHNFIQL